MTPRVQRLLVTASIGVLAASIVAGLISLQQPAATNAVSLASLGGLAGILVVGALVGVVFGVVFSDVVKDTAHMAQSLAKGAVIGVVGWLIADFIARPVFTQTAEVVSREIAFAPLLAYGFVGVLVGLGTHVSRRWLAVEPEQQLIPEISSRVVVIGGGYAGVTAAQVLERELAHDPTVGIFLISQTNYLVHTPMLSEVSSSAVNPQDISPPLRNFFKRVQVVQGTVKNVSMDGQQVTLAADARSPERTLAFDQLILAPGGVPNFFGNDSVAKHAFTFKSLSDAMCLRNQLIDCFERADLEPDEAKRRELLTFVVAGGGFAGVELIGGLNDFARGMVSYYPNIAADEVSLILVHARDQILPELSASLGEYAQDKLEQRGVTFKLNARVTGAEANAVLIGDERIPSRTFVWTAGNKPSPILETLGLPLNKRGQLELDTELRVVGVPGVWAAGDCAQIPDLTTGGMCPPTAQHALREGKLAGYNVAASLKGKPIKTFKYKSVGSLASLGHQLAVAEVMGVRFSGFFAWFMWRAIYLIKLPTFQKQLRVGLDWWLDVFFPPDIVQTIDFSNTSDDVQVTTSPQPIAESTAVARSGAKV
ncbi:MAG: NAD(P)/FAD-dependent oxidoreductase [Deinococcota bacterium]